jgi:hypothetical protein
VDKSTEGGAVSSNTQLAALEKQHRGAYIGREGNLSRNAYKGSMRPFLRFINLFYRESGHIETMTLERMDALEATCIKLCDEFHSWHDAKYG